MKYRETALAIMAEMNQVLIGKEDKVRLLMVTLLSGGHLLLEDVPGVGKTTMAKALKDAVGLSFGRIQFTPDTLPGDVLGVSVYQMDTGAFRYIEGSIMHQLILADEINRTSPKTQASLLEAMEEGQVTVDGICHPLPKPFMVVATQNPVDFLGTYNLPEAQLDRFSMRITLGYPDKEQEIRMAGLFLKGEKKKQRSPVADADALLCMKEEVDRIFIHQDLIAYTASIIQATRESEHLTLGASPRATLALLKAAQAEAYLNGRDYVIPDDIKILCEPVLCHRLILSMEAKMKKLTPWKALKEAMVQVPVPILRQG